MQIENVNHISSGSYTTSTLTLTKESSQQDQFDNPFDFGKLYEDNLLLHIHKYLEVDTHNKLLYIGDRRANFVPTLEKYFCLLNQVTTCYYSDGKTRSGRLQVLSNENGNSNSDVFVENRPLEINEYIDLNVTASNKSVRKFDRILIHDCARNVKNLQKTFTELTKILHKFGKILFIQRDGPINTLPISRKAKEQNAKNDLPFIDIIKALEATGSDIQWDLVHVPFNIPKQRWFQMIYNRFPDQPHYLNEEETLMGMKELISGSFRYLNDEIIEGEDRLLMITCSHQLFDCAYPSVQRCRGASQVPYHEKGDVNFYLAIDEEIEKELEKIK